MTSVKFSKILAVILAAMLMLTLLTTAVFATDADADAENTPASSEAAESSAEPDETEAPADNADETKAPADSSDDKKDEKKSLNWDLIISLSIIGLAVVAFVVLYFAVPKFHARVNTFCREYKSELGKVVWSPLRDVKQNTAIVIIIVAVSALLIGVLDFIFSKGIIGLGSLL